MLSQETKFKYAEEKRRRTELLNRIKYQKMKEFKKISLAFLMISVIFLAASIIINEKFCIAASEQESSVSGIELNKGDMAPDFTI